METRTLLRESSAAVKILSLVSRFPFMKSLVAGSLSLSHGPPPVSCSSERKDDRRLAGSFLSYHENQPSRPLLFTSAWALMSRYEIETSFVQEMELSQEPGSLDRCSIPSREVSILWSYLDITLLFSSYVYLIFNSYFVNLRTSEIHLFYNLQVFYWHFLEILWLFIFLVLYLWSPLPSLLPGL